MSSRSWTEEGYGMNEEKCLQCSKNCSHCYFEKGIEKCTTCKENKIQALADGIEYILNLIVTNKTKFYK